MIKEKRGGKYHGQMRNPMFPNGQDAGVVREPGGGGEPIKREFVGTKMKEYTFSDEKHGTHTIVAISYPEALRIAKTLGFSKRDYQKKRYRRK